MKATIDIECTPDEARRFLGLPDVTRANELYVEKVTNLMSGVTSAEQLQDFAKQLAPFGQAGLKFFQQMYEQGAGAAFGGFTPRSGRRRDSDD
jgi:hypothetical protein